MHLEQLEYIVEIAKAGSLTKAAQNKHVTLSAISQSLSSLEAELGIALFTRSRLGAVPTSEGRVIIKKAFEVLSKIEEIQEEAQSSANTLSGELRLATIPGPMDLLVNAVSSFKRTTRKSASRSPKKVRRKFWRTSGRTSSISA